MKNYDIFISKKEKNYENITKLQKKKSYLDNYNKKIKSAFGRNKNIYWPNFVSFIKD